MPYKSEAQRKLFHAKAKRGEISKDVVNEFDKASKGLKLPKRITKYSARPYRPSPHKPKIHRAKQK